MHLNNTINLSMSVLTKMFSACMTAIETNFFPYIALYPVQTSKRCNQSRIYTALDVIKSINTISNSNQTLQHSLQTSYHHAQRITTGGHQLNNEKDFSRLIFENFTLTKKKMLENGTTFTVQPSLAPNP